jgi:hypothetical protein
MTQNFTLHSYVGPDGILRIDVPVKFTDNYLEVALTIQPDTSPKGMYFSEEEEPKGPTLVEENGILVANVKPLRDLTNITREERDRRLWELVRRVAW